MLLTFSVVVLWCVEFVVVVLFPAVSLASVDPPVQELLLGARFLVVLTALLLLLTVVAASSRGGMISFYYCLCVVVVAVWVDDCYFSSFRSNWTPLGGLLIAPAI